MAQLEQLVKAGGATAPRHRGALEGLRVLDLCGISGAYATKLLADLGADVVMLEDPQRGSSVRALGPWLDGDPDQSLLFAYLSTNKRSVTLDLETDEGRRIFRRLASLTDLVVEDLGPGQLERLGLDWDALHSENAGLVLTRISPFGQTGPLRDYVASDLILWAMGGMLYLAGYPDSSPLLVDGSQAYFAASVFAAVGTLVAVLEACNSRQGQTVDVSTHEAVAMGLENAAQFYQLQGLVRRRNGAQPSRAGTGLFPCKDGYVYLSASGMAERAWPRLIEWLSETGADGVEILRSTKWRDLSYRLTLAAIAEFAAIFGAFVAGEPKQRLYEEAQRRHIPLAPVNSAADVLASPQLRARSHFIDVRPEGYSRRFEMPGAPYVLSATPWAVATTAPRPGSANRDVYGEIGLSAGELCSLREHGII